jgi:hypothetical protein
VAESKPQAGVLGLRADLPLYPFGVLGHGALAQHCKPIAHETSSLTRTRPLAAGEYLLRVTGEPRGTPQCGARGAGQARREIRLPGFP